MKINGKRCVYRLLSPDGEVLGVAGQHRTLQVCIDRGTRTDTDENDDLIEVPLPAVCRIVEVWQ